MDIKLKNNRRQRRWLAAFGIAILSLAVLACFPLIAGHAQQQFGDWVREGQICNEWLLQELYRGSYVLYQEAKEAEGQVTAADVYLGVGEEISGERRAMLGSQVDAILQTLGAGFEEYRSNIDYYAQLSDGTSVTNTTRGLEDVLKSGVEDVPLRELYEACLVIRFDGNGAVDVEIPYPGELEADEIVKAFGRVVRSEDLLDYAEDDTLREEAKILPPTDFTLVYGIPRNPENGRYDLVTEDGSLYWESLRICGASGGWLLYVISIAMVAGLVFALTSRRIWGGEIDLNRPGKWYLMEAAVVGLICVPFTYDPFLFTIAEFAGGYEELISMLTGVSSYIDTIVELFVLWLGLGVCYGGLYLCVAVIRPVFSLGLREYIRQYSLLYQIFPWAKRLWHRLRKEIEHIDFNESSTKTIGKIVLLNFVVLAFISSFWFFGIFALVAYSVVLFYLIKTYYDRMRKCYQLLYTSVDLIAEGKLDVEVTTDMGIFEPFKQELAKIRTGFKRAVDEEVKSQRMKTELITNVSHDLKTPLTAILTYVELLKKEGITEEERRGYIETLERKSLRLKVLIEDLFEVSKANSDNITLNLADVDIVHLMKQVSIEHEKEFEKAGLLLRWRVPEEKLLLHLDSQKAYRIFENLFVNIQKYAMPGSRVYVDVECLPREEDAVEGIRQGLGTARIILRNMSAGELDLAADEITERFVRGDASRNTEGSGLGLAIAKSFTEAMGGDFAVEVDGDLFKVVICWNYGIL